MEFEIWEFVIVVVFFNLEGRGYCVIFATPQDS